MKERAMSTEWSVMSTEQTADNACTDRNVLRKSWKTWDEASHEATPYSKMRHFKCANFLSERFDLYESITTERDYHLEYRKKSRTHRISAGTQKCTEEMNLFNRWTYRTDELIKQTLYFYLYIYICIYRYSLNCEY